MKKTLVSALTTALVVGAASTTFAAANPFEDVPADHWAYDAVAQLASDGVVEGYGDGTYRGDQTITRYEMAQMVARAMAKSGISAADKAMIDRLAAEFADELNALGVRVAALEKKVDNVKWNGLVRYRYVSDRHEGEEYYNSQNVTLRLEPSMMINKHWTGHARLDYQTDMNDAKKATGEDLEVDRIWVEGQYGSTNLNFGKIPFVTNVDNGMLADDVISGGQVTFGNDVKIGITVGRANQGGDYGDMFGLGENATASYQGVEVYNDRDAKFTWGVGYHRFLNKTRYETKKLGGDKTKKALNIWDLGLGYKLTDEVALNGAYAWNTAAVDEFWGCTKSKRAWSVELDYKGADSEDKGSFGIFAAYRSLGSAAVWIPTYDTIGAAQKGWEFGLDYVFDKNMMGTVKYFTGKDMYVGGDENASTIFTELNFFF